MTRTAFLSAVLAFAALAPQSYARSEDILDFFNVQTLDRDCKLPEQSPFFRECFGYVRGVADTLIAQKIICVGERFSYLALTQAFVNWADAHPEEWSNFQALGVTQALVEKWPCK